MPLTPETTTMAAARPWSLLKFGDDIWLRTPSAAQLLSLRGMEIRALPTSTPEEVDARHGPFEYLACHMTKPAYRMPDRITHNRHQELTNVARELRQTILDTEGILFLLLHVNNTRCEPPLPKEEVEHIVESSEDDSTSPEKWLLDNIRTALGLTDITDGASVLHTIGKLLEEHDEVVGLRTLMTNRVEEIQRLREEIRRQAEGVPSEGEGAEIERLRNALLRRELNHLAEIERLRNALHAQTEKLSETEFDLARRTRQVETLASTKADLRDDLGALAKMNANQRDAILKKEKTIQEFDHDRQTERKRADKLADENAVLRATVRCLSVAP